jgi:hypothetical protein
MVAGARQPRPADEPAPERRRDLATPQQLPAGSGSNREQQQDGDEADDRRLLDARRAALPRSRALPLGLLGVHARKLGAGVAREPRRPSQTIL